MVPLNNEQILQVRDERKEQIMRAALKVFAERGIEGSKISMIAAEAGVSQGLFYHYFKSKDEAVITLVQIALEASYSATKSLQDMPISSLEKIRFLTQSIIEDGGKYYFLLIHQARISEDLPDQIKVFFSQYSMKAYVDLMMPIFEEGQREGVIAAGDLEKLISSYFSILSGVMVVNAGGSSLYTIPEVEMIMRLVTK
ncbi:TetR/AcrR family transcriptional regulator [Paenibacillus albiflavus]|uniref:TetR/AcrR family transcriptional regulator n=1 Tax=Paenibacillus albiflavus TaxID=2545760 RepID=A0A4V2WNH5_9BACL|nr:TetR/AcrR family transcriptional regulator [Paenibacillus albiflavus]TCZ75492.1 TetR/AcrR family transcriptional regulator [Paenibacillus albiflavus]